MLRATTPIDHGRVAVNCERRKEASNGNDWWICDHCGSLWTENLNGLGWLPLACPERKVGVHQQLKREG